jgi:hypothetical protein
MSTTDDFNDPQPKKGMSSTSKVLIILGSIGGLCLLACCGGGAFLFYRLKDNFAMSSDPAVVKKSTEEIVLIDVPSDFTPTQSMKISMMGVSMKWAIYTKGGGNDSMMMLMEMNQPGMAAQGGVGAKQQRDQMLQAMRQQQAQQGGAGQFNTEINEQSVKSRKFKINGETVEFDFIKGTRPNGGDVHQVVGVFPSRGGGVVMLMLIVPADGYDEESIVTMIKSIRMDASTPAGSVTEVEGDEAEKATDEAEDMKEDAEKSE